MSKPMTKAERTRYARLNNRAIKDAGELFGLKNRRRKESVEQRLTVAATLMHSPDQRMQELARMCLDPKNDITALTTLSLKLGLNFHHIADEFKRLRRSQGIIRISQHLPDLMEDAAIDARTVTVPCDACDGTGEVPATSKRKGAAVDKPIAQGNGSADGTPNTTTEATMKTCPDCHGQGKIRIMGDKERLKMVFEMVGALGVPKGPLVNLNLSELPSDGESMGDLADSLGPLLHGNASTGEVNANAQENSDATKMDINRDVTAAVHASDPLADAVARAAAEIEASFD